MICDAMRLELDAFWAMESLVVILALEAAEVLIAVEEVKVLRAAVQALV